MPTPACTCTRRQRRSPLPLPPAHRQCPRAAEPASRLATLHLQSHLAFAATRLPLRQLLLPLDRRERVAVHLAQQLLVVAQAIGRHAFAHRAAGFVTMPAVAK